MDPAPRNGPSGIGSVTDLAGRFARALTSTGVRERWHFGRRGVNAIVKVEVGTGSQKRLDPDLAGQ